jgi:hypothetical protein
MNLTLQPSFTGKRIQVPVVHGLHWRGSELRKCHDYSFLLLFSLQVGFTLGICLMCGVLHAFRNLIFDKIYLEEVLGFGFCNITDVSMAYNSVSIHSVA